LRALFQLSGVEFYRQQNGFPRPDAMLVVSFKRAAVAARAMRISQNQRIETQIPSAAATVKQIAPGAEQRPLRDVLLFAFWSCVTELHSLNFLRRGASKFSTSIYLSLSLLRGVIALIWQRGRLRNCDPVCCSLFKPVNNKTAP
jgi:hypothetical protein